MKKTKKREKKKTEQVGKRWGLWLFIGLVILVVGGFLIKTIIDNALYNRFPDRGLARINIELNDVSLDDIKSGSKEAKYEGNGLAIYHDGEIIEYDDVEIKGRGNLSWDQPKKSYQIKFSKSTDLFGLGKTKKWVLIANYLDRSYIRNDAAFLFADMLGMDYNNRGKFVEVYFKGEYEGLYYLIEKIEISKASVDLRKNGSLLFELDNLHNSGGCYKTYLDNCLIVKDKINKDKNEDDIEDFLRDFNKLEIAAEKGEYEDIKEIIDIDSFIDFYLTKEFTVDPDAYSSSFYLYRSGPDGKIFAGPVWDFDLAFGNKAWGWEQVGDDFYLPSEKMFRKKEAFGRGGLKENKNISKLFYYLMDIDDFENEVVREYNEKISNRKIEYLIILNNVLNEISDAAKADGIKWGRNDFEQYSEELIDWIKKRFDFFDSEYEVDYDSTYYSK